MKLLVAPMEVADNAAALAAPGAEGIDFNFGCPEPTVSAFEAIRYMGRYPNRVTVAITTLAGEVVHGTSCIGLPNDSNRVRI